MFEFSPVTKQEAVCTVEVRDFLQMEVSTATNVSVILCYKGGSVDQGT